MNEMLKKLLIPLVIGIAIVIYYLVSPLFYDIQVDEPLPAVVHEEVPQPSPMRDMPDEDKELFIELNNITPEEVEAMPANEQEELKGKMEDLGKRMQDTEISEHIMTNQTQKPSLLKRGSFVGADSFHKGSGMASIYIQGDGSQLLRLESFSVTNGPALFVYLVKNTSGDLDDGFVDIGKLKGNKGNQNYPIPANIDATEYGSVVIWCKPFGVLFSTASFTQ